MTQNYTPITSALLSTLIATEALSTLVRQSIYARVATTNYQNEAFQVGEQVTIRIARKRSAQSVDPRGAGLTVSEGTYYSTTFNLENLWGDGFPVYGSDPQASIDRYVEEVGLQAGYGIGTANDDYMYSKFRTVTATSGTGIQYGASAPLAICANTDPTTGDFVQFDNSILRDAGYVLDQFLVPDRDGQRYAIIGSRPKADFLGDSIRVTGFAAGLQGSGDLILNGLPQNTFAPYNGFSVGASTVVTGQSAVATMDTGATAPKLPIAAIAQDTTIFFDSIISPTLPLGAVGFTLTATTALKVSAGGVAVGQIAQIQTSSSNGAALAHFVILRINTTTPTAPILYGVPYSPSGVKLDASAFTTSNVVRIPLIGAVNEAHHREALLMATRPVRTPPAGSGAVSASLVDPATNLLVQIMIGAYDIKHVQQDRAYYMLTGSQMSDWHKAVLMLTA